MARLSWLEFISRFPIVHLLVGVVSAAETPANSRKYADLVARLVAWSTRGQYALTVDRQHGVLQVHCLFEEESDVRTISDVVGAQPCNGYLVSGSQRSFILDEVTRQSIRKALSKTED